jgi:hypothetical protein
MCRWEVVVVLYEQLQSKREVVCGLHECLLLVPVDDEAMRESIERVAVWGMPRWSMVDERSRGRWRV